MLSEKDLLPPALFKSGGKKRLCCATKSVETKNDSFIPEMADYNTFSSVSMPDFVFSF